MRGLGEGELDQGMGSVYQVYEHHQSIKLDYPRHLTRS